MIISKRTKLSISQFMGLLKTQTISTLMDKHDIDCESDTDHNDNKRYNQLILQQSILQADNKSIKNLLEEILTTENYLEESSNSKSGFYERLIDLKKCLLLDGLELEYGVITPISS